MRGKYLNPKADLTFKKIFGEHPNLVISLLNALLPLKEDERIERIEYWPAEKIPRRTQAEKDSIVDVCCHDSKKREFIVEMQMTWTEAFKKRVLLNASKAAIKREQSDACISFAEREQARLKGKAYVAQSEVGEVYQRLQPVYALNFVNESMNLDTEGYYHHYQLVHQEKSDEVIDGLQLVFIELPKFKPQSFSDKRMQVLWLRFLTEINEHTMEAPGELLENPEVCQALKIVEVAAYSPLEMRAYDKFWDAVSTARTLEYARKQEILDYQAKVSQAKEQIAQAKEQIAQAKEQATQAKEQATQAKEQAAQAKEQAAQTEARLLQTVHNLKSMHLTSEQIAAATGLTVKEVEAL